ncbi:MAG TPA: DUF4163 domain-containing protein [Rhizomicrobium sp.]|jgi:hypothetical protein
MNKFVTAVASVMVLAGPVWAADYDKTEKSALYEFHLHVPTVAMSIPPLRDKIIAMYNADAAQAKADAKDDKESNPSFSPYSIDTTWRVTFENDFVLSLSAEIYADTGGAHPNSGFQTIVWDKKAAHAVRIDGLFAPGQTKAALAAIGDAATRAWNKTYTQRSGQKPGPDADVATAGIGADTGKLATYALTYAKGQKTANGIVLLYGAGQVWPHVLGDFRLSVPARVFDQYLAPQWKPVFSAAP